MSTRRERVRSVDNRDGWRFEVRHYFDPDRLDGSRSPVLLIPGYGMNTFVLDYHPTDVSLVQFLVDSGFEVFTANLRAQGNSSPIRGLGKVEFGFEDVARLDLPVVVDHVLHQTVLDAECVTAMGCSLGATYLHAYLALHPGRHRLDRMVSIGGPLRWVEQHPLMRVAFASERLASAIPFRGTRALAKRVLPVVKNVPPLLSIYMNARDIDLSEATVLTNTVDDPVPSLNAEIARWVNRRDLTVAGVNVTEAMRDVQIPLLCVAANRDGIVPVPTALSATDHWGGGTDSHVAGDSKRWFAHADLFINNRARPEVFGPIVDWLV